MGALINSVIISLVLLYPAWRIFKRAGIHPGLAFTVLVPMAGPLIATFILAFTRWPNEPEE